MAQEVRPMPEEMPRELWRGYMAASKPWRGSVKEIFVARESAEPMVSLPSVRAFADRGLEGDRFFRDSWNAVSRPDKSVSLIEDEVLELAAKELGLEAIGILTRRNIVSRGVPLIELLGRGLGLAACACAASGCSSPAAISSRSPSCRAFSKPWSTAAVSRPKS